MMKTDEKFVMLTETELVETDGGGQHLSQRALLLVFALLELESIMVIMTQWIKKSNGEVP